MEIKQVIQYKAENGYTYNTIEEARKANEWSRFLQILATKVDGFKGKEKYDLQYLVAERQFDPIREAYQEFEREGK